METAEQTEAARGILAADFRDLALESIEFLGEGWDHAAYLVDGDLVFRIPWETIEESTVEDLPTAGPEIALLRAVHGQLPVTAPQPAWIAPDERYFGYRYLPGQSVFDVVDDWTSPPMRARLADLITEVILGVERLVTPEDGRSIGLEHLGDPPQDLAHARRALESGRLPRKVTAVADRVFDGYVTRWESAVERRMSVLHGDLGLDHWLIDRAGAVYALIDWSDACIAPPEHQLSTLMWHIPDLAGEVTELYAAATGDEPDRELIFADGYLNALGDLSELVEEGEDEEDIDRCVRFVTSWSERGPG